MQWPSTPSGFSQSGTPLGGSSFGCSGALGRGGTFSPRGAFGRSGTSASLISHRKPGETVAQWAATIEEVLDQEAEEAESQELELLYSQEEGGPAPSRFSCAPGRGLDHLRLQARLQEFLDLPACNAVVGFAILLNVACVTISVDNPDEEVWDDMNRFFTFFFTAEVLLRFGAVGCWGFFCGAQQELGWNVFDLFVVITSLLCELLKTLGLTTQGGKFVRLLRTLRVLRVLRVLSIFRLQCLKKLQIIVSGLIQSMVAISWIGFLLVVVMVASAIVCTDLVGSNAEEWHEEQGDILLYFGSVESSVMTLFQFLTLADWAEVTRLVSKQRPTMYVFFLAYVIVAAMVLLSLLTGVMADHMNSVREEEEEREQLALQEERAVAVRTEYKAFKQASENGRHLIDKKQFMTMLENKKIQQELEDIGVQTEGFDAGELFDCFDGGASGAITWHEFRRGMEELRTGVTPKQLFKLQVSLQRAVQQCRGQRKAGSPMRSCERYRQADQAEALLSQATNAAVNLESALDALDADIRGYLEQYGSPRSASIGGLGLS